MRITKLFKEFFESEKAGGLVLMACTFISLLLANSAWGETYRHFWHLPLGSHPVEFWINDGLMTIFFLLIGLEIERELYQGELSSLKNALLPISAAVGGMAVPALIHFFFNRGTEFSSGIGIPMATDIAFALGILSLLGKRVPTSAKVFLTALAIIDDLGAIVVIALFYSKGFSLLHFSLAAAVFGVLILMNRLHVHRLLPYLILGAAMWYFLLRSGIHATITGVLLAFAIPFGKGDSDSPSYRLQHWLHAPVAFGILPIFALANTGIEIPNGWLGGLSSSNSIGILLGLLVGKPLGISLFSWFSSRLGICSLSSDLRWRHLLGLGFLAGIGFTMSIFITLLAFSEAEVVVQSKIAVFAASVLAAALGFFLLKILFNRQVEEVAAD